MSVGATPSRAQRQLAGELLHLRNLAGLDQRQLAAQIGLSQASVSRIERAQKTLPTLPQVISWAKACGAVPDVVERLAALTEAVYTHLEPWRELLEQQAQLQDAVAANEATAQTLRNFSNVFVPGLLQTADYARRIFALTNVTGREDEAAALAGRLRRQEALHDLSRRFEFVITEAALRWPAGGTETMRAQADRIISLSTLENLTAAVLPAGAEPVLPRHGFVIYDDLRDDGEPFVTVELLHTYVTIRDPRDVQLYREAFELLRAAAVTGRDAVALVQRVAAEFRG